MPCEPIRAGPPLIIAEGMQGAIDRGLNDYDRIFSIVHAAGFDGWISSEDGADPAASFENIRQSAVFLCHQMAQHRLSHSSA